MIFASIVINILLTVFITVGKTEPVHKNNSDVPLLSQVFIDSALFFEYSYNNDNLICIEKSKYRYIRHNYNSKNQLVSTDYYEDLSFASSDMKIVEAGRNRKEWVI